MRHPSESDDRARSKRIGALAALWPYLRRYRGMLAAALAALVLTAAVALILPIAVRRVVDGFETSAEQLLDQYFLAALGIAALMAVGTGLRYYLVTRLGERVVADIRKAVFDRVIGMSPGLLRADHDRRGAEPDHHRHDADPVGDRLLGLGGAAQRALARGRARADALYLAAS